MTGEICRDSLGKSGGQLSTAMRAHRDNVSLLIVGWSISRADLFIGLICKVRAPDDLNTDVLLAISTGDMERISLEYRLQSIESF